jgi:hypothetical protein
MNPSRKKDRKMLAALSASFSKASGQRLSAATLRSRLRTGSPVLTVLMRSRALLLKCEIPEVIGAQSPCRKYRGRDSRENDRDVFNNLNNARSAHTLPRVISPHVYRHYWLLDANSATTVLKQ